MRTKYFAPYFIPTVVGIFVVIAVAIVFIFRSYAFWGAASVVNQPYSGPVQAQPVVASPAEQKITVKNVTFEEQNGQYYLKWTPVNEANVSYSVGMVEDGTQNNLPLFAKKVFTSSVGTFVNGVSQKTSNNKEFFVADRPNPLVNQAAIAYGQAVTSSGSQTSITSLISGLKGNKIYSFIVKSQQGTVSAFSDAGVVIHSSQYLANYWPFQDVTQGQDWFYNPVKDLYDRGVVEAADYFYPAQLMTRTEAVVWVMKALGFAVTQADADFAKNKFADVNGNEPYAQYLGYMAKNNWIGGIRQQDGTTVFDGNSELTRVQMLKVLVEAFRQSVQIPQNQVQVGYNDVDVHAWYVQYVRIAVAMGVLDGNGQLNPARSVNRAEMAKMLSVLLTVKERVENLLNN